MNQTQQRLTPIAFPALRVRNAAKPNRSKSSINSRPREILDTTHYDRWPVTGGPDFYGYFMCAPEADDPAIPRDLWACSEFARVHDCAYLCFDSDADRYPALKDHHP